MHQQSPDHFEDARKAIEESHTYVRNNMSLWVQWFTFFITVNYLGFGWFAQDSAKNGKITYPRPLRYVAVLLISQCILGICVSLILRRWFLTSDQELSSKYRALPVPPHRPPSSSQFYATAIALGCGAMVGLIIAWASFAIWP